MTRTRWWTVRRFSWLDLFWIFLIVSFLRAIAHFVLEPLADWLVKAVF